MSSVELYNEKKRSEPVPIPGTHFKLRPVDAEAVWEGDGLVGNEVKFSKESQLSCEDHATQQMIFDRLPLSKSKRAELYKWLLDEHSRSRIVSDDGTREGDDEGEERALQQCSLDGLESQGSC
jgi:hypothetical protein